MNDQSANSSRAFSRFGLGILLAVAVALRVSFMEVPRRTPDERFYAAFAARVAQEGPGATRAAVREFNEGPRSHPYPWPARAGFMWMAGAATRVSGDSTPRAVANLSAVASVLSVALLALLAFRLFGAWPAALAILLLVASPLDLAMARRGWQDSTAGFLSLAMMACVAWSGSAARRGPPALAFFALSAVALTVKESLAIPFAVGTLALAVHAWRAERGVRGPALIGVAGVAAALAAAGTIVGASGGIEPLRRALELGRLVNAPNPYMREFQTGSPAYYLLGLALLHPLPFALGGLAALLAVLRAPFLLSPWRRPGARAALVALGWFVLVFGVTACSWPQKNLRFLAPIVAPVALLGAALLAASRSWIAERAPRRTANLAAIALAIVLAAAAALDERRFVHDFITLGIPDLATPWFTRAAGPGR